MEGLTLGEINGAITFIAGLLGSVGVIALYVNKHLGKIIQENLEPTNRKIDKLTEQVEDVDMANCKNFLVQVISDLEAGRSVDKVVQERFYEEYDHYTKLGGNSYIHTAIEKLKKKGKI